MHLSSIFKEYGIDINQTKLVRHPLNKTDIAEVYAQGFIEAYQASQTNNPFDKCRYIATFMGSNQGTEAKFIGLYEIKDKIVGKAVTEQMPEGYPYPDHFDENHQYYVMEKLDVMNELDNKLIIQWGESYRQWAQWAANDKEVVSIANREEVPFPGYEYVIADYTRLGEIISDPRYSKWNEALSNINAIYLICDKKRSKQYIGSTYGTQGLLGRWTDYYKTKDGGDVGIKSHLNEHPKAFLDFQFTILKVLQKPISINEATDVESLYKNKLLTRTSSYGLNDN